MRSKLVGLILGCATVALVASPSLACSFNTQASTTQGQQQTAQAQTSAPTQAR